MLASTAPAACVTCSGTFQRQAHPAAHCGTVTVSSGVRPGRRRVRAGRGARACPASKLTRAELVPPAEHRPVPRRAPRWRPGVAVVGRAAPVHGSDLVSDGCTPGCLSPATMPQSPQARRTHDRRSANLRIRPRQPRRSPQPRPGRPLGWARPCRRETPGLDTPLDVVPHRLPRADGRPARTTIGRRRR